MDPGSVVRESEMSMAASGDSVFAAALAKGLKQVEMGGGQLSPKVRESLRREIRNKVVEMNKAYSAQRVRFRDDAEAFGLDPARIIGNHDGETYRELFRDYDAARAKQRADNEVPGQVNGAPAKEPPPGLIDSASGTLAPINGETRRVPNDKANSKINALINAGAWTLANQELRKLGQAPISPSERKEIQDWQRANPGRRYNATDIADVQPVTAAQQVLNSPTLAPLATGLASYANAATAGTAGALAGAEAQGNLAAAQAMNPRSALTGNVVGGITGAVGAEAALAARLGGKLLPYAPRLADTAFGAASGFNAAEDGQGAQGAALGAITGLGGGYLGSKIGQGISQIRAPASSYLSPAERSIAGTVKGDLASVRPVVEEAGRLDLPFSLADADPRLRSLAGSVTRKSVDARALAEGVLEPRALGQGERAIRAIDQNLAQSADLPALQQSAIERARQASRPFYDSAMEQGAPEDAVLSELLRRPGAERGAREAYGIALNRGENPAELSFTVGVDGQPILNANPNWKTLQYIKMGLDEQLEPFRNPITGKLNLESNVAKGLDDLRQGLNARMGELNPDYAKGNAEYARLAGQGTAAQRGASNVSPRVTPEDTARSLASLREGERPFFEQGYASALADAVEKGSETRNPFASIYGSMGQQAKLGTVFPEGAQTFGRIADFEKEMGKTTREVLGGSPTAGRQAADEQLQGGLGTTALDFGSQLATGGGIGLGSILQAGRNVLGDNLRLGIGKQAVRRADEIAPVLFNTSPQDVTAILDDLIARSANKMARQRAFGAGGGAGGAGLGSSVLTPLLIGQ
jgi:hypothetical protein